jgi:hypothetical protein
MVRWDQRLLLEVWCPALAAGEDHLSRCSRQARAVTLWELPLPSGAANLEWAGPKSVLRYPGVIQWPPDVWNRWSLELNRHC